MEIVKSPQVIPGHHINTLCTFSLSHVSTEITNLLKSTQDPQESLSTFPEHLFSINFLIF